MVENNVGDPKQEIRRTHVMALMRFFSVESDMSLPNANPDAQMPEMVSLASLRNKQFVLKVVQLVSVGVSFGKP